MTRPETMCRYPREADAVEEGAQTMEGLFRAGVAALVACGSSQEVQVCLPPPRLWSAPRSANFYNLDVGDGRAFKSEKSNVKRRKPGITVVF